MKQKFLLLLIVSLIIFTPFNNSVYAEQETITLETESINPGSTFYPLKRAWEKILEKVNFSAESKINYHRSLLKVRLSELSYVVEKNLLGDFQTSSERFAYQAGILVDNLSNASEDKKKEAISDFEKYVKVLEQLRDKHPANTSYWMLIQHDINTLKILSEKLK